VEVSRSYLFDGYIASLQSALVRAQPHRHAAYQLTLSLDGKPHRLGPSLERARAGLIHLVGSNVPHAFDGADGEQLLLWLPPESALGRRLGHTHLQRQDMELLPQELFAGLPLDELRQALHGPAPASRVREDVDRLLSALTQGTARPPQAVHPAVRKAVRIVGSLESARISADELASRVGLSKSRLLHVFKEDMGIPLRPYLQWLRCIDGITLLAGGTSVTDAALAAGFTDGAHFNRVLKRYVCLSPSAFTGERLRVVRGVEQTPE